MMGNEEEDRTNPFASILEPFSGLSEIDFELHGIYIDHEPEDEFVSTLDKCKDKFLNVLLSDENLRESSMTDEVRAQVYHCNDRESDNEAEEEVKTKYRIHDPNTQWNKMVPKVGDVFENPTQLKFCVTNYAVANGYQIYFQKCDNTRVTARCGKRGEDSVCPYRIHATWMYNDRSFQIKNLIDEHQCRRHFKNLSIVTPEWIGRHFMSTIANKPKIKLREMITDIKMQFGVEVSIGQCRRAKKWAKDLIEGKLSEHYARIWDYAHEMIRSNPGSTCQVGVTLNPDQKNYFHRFYICFKAITVGWKRGCRRVIGLDGCFLKGEIKGELLTAIGRDANNQVFPIAWAVVDVENKANWTWFLELLCNDLHLDGGRGLVVISDQHKGLLQAVKDILPYVEHRQCARHIYANFRKAYSGLEYKKLFWAAAMSCVEGDFKRNMENLKKLSPGAYDYLMSKQPRSWCRAYFSTGYACEAVENGISECFNAIIIDARSKPLITMLEEIRIYIMDRFAHMTHKCKNWKSNVCPSVLKKIKLFGKSMRYWLVVHSQGNVFEARKEGDSYKVDLDARMCTCRLWELSGIPCVHALATINYINEPPDAYVSELLKKDKFVECYVANILPVNGSNLWPDTEYIKPLPPLSRKMPGRPATKRRRHASENESKFNQARVTVQRTVRCQKCLEYGHNKKGCKNEAREPVPKPPTKIGRPRKHPIAPSTSQSTTRTNQSGPMEGGTNQGNGTDNQQESVHGTPHTLQKPPRKRKKTTKGGAGVQKRRKLSVNRGGGKTRGKVSAAKNVVAAVGVESQQGCDSQQRCEGQQESQLGLDRQQESQYGVVSQKESQNGFVSHQESENVLDNQHGSQQSLNTQQGREFTNSLLNLSLASEHEGYLSQNVKETTVLQADSCDGKTDEQIQPTAIDSWDKIAEPHTELTETLAGVEDGINQILGIQSDNEGDDGKNEDAHVFDEGNATGVVPPKVVVGGEDLILLLEAGYTMEQLEASGRIQIEQEPMTPVEIEIDQHEEQPNMEEGDEERENEFEGDGEMQTEPDLLVTRKRRPSERIMKQKLKHAVFDKDGGGSSTDNPVALD